MQSLTEILRAGAPFFISLTKIVGFTFFLLLPMVAYSVYAERRFSAIIQDRLGPNRVGLPLSLLGFKNDLHFAGLFQPMADGLKGFFKEEFTPNHVKKSYFIIAPILVMAPALISFSIIPISSSIGGHRLVIADMNSGPLLLFALSSLSVYGIVLAGWSSNSKYAFLGGVRSSGQMISYEIALALSILPVFMIYGNLNLGDIIEFQQKNGWLIVPFSGPAWFKKEFWFYFLPVIISFIIFTVSLFAETNRTPFDLPECETELVGGYHTEYSAMKFALFFMGEYAAMIVGSALIVILFFGGWSLPFGLLADVDRSVFWKDLLVALAHMFTFLAKLIFFILFFIWVRWSVPRFRYDQLMKLGWLVFFEVAIVNVLLLAVIMYFVVK